MMFEDVKEARAHGDLSENFEYKAAKREKNRNESRIRYLENMIETAIIVETDSREGVIGLFDRVKIYYPEDDEYREIRLVTTLRNDVFKDCISQDSPFGKALMGKKVGQTVTVHVNAAVSYPVKILEVIKGEDDPDLPISTY